MIVDVQRMFPEMRSSFFAFWKEPRSAMIEKKEGLALWLIVIGLLWFLSASIFEDIQAFVK